MRLLSIGECVVTTFLFGVVFLVGAILDTATTTATTKDVLWTRTCTLTTAEGKGTVVCGDVEQPIAIDRVVANIFPAGTQKVMCDARLSSGLPRNVALECHAP